MNLGLKGKTALVTGSTAGIGYATARALAREGAAVVVNGRTQERVDEAVQKIKAESGSEAITGVAADLGTAAGVAELIKQVPTLDVLVNNVAIFEPKDFGDITDDDWLRFFETNVLSGVRLSRQYLPLMKGQNWGRIVFVSSESAVNIPAEMIHYGMSKTAQLAVARGLAETTAGTAVTVNSVLPGPTNSEGVGTFIAQMAQSSGKDVAAVTEEFFQHVRPSSLLKRFEDVDEIAALVTFVCGTVSSGINGAALRVDSGVVRSVV